jgi:hypothetical protein
MYPSQPPGIFVSYRRIDSLAYAGRLFDRLSDHFGDDRVFMDIEGGIARGDDFPQAIETALQMAAAVVVLIGRQWVTCTDAHGKRRLDHSDDWVRTEIVTALKRKVLLLPVLVGGAAMPTQSDLPTELQSLTRKQASEISDGRWDYDVGEIIKALERVVPPAPPGLNGGGSTTTKAGGRSRVLRFIGMGLAAAMVVIAGLVLWDQFVAPKPSDYDFAADPPQIRIRRDTAAVQTVRLTVTNTGKRRARFSLSAQFFGASPTAGAFSIRDDTCGNADIVPLKSCTANVTFDPSGLEPNQTAERFTGQISILAHGNGGAIPLTIEPPAAPAPQPIGDAQRTDRGAPPPEPARNVPKPGGTVEGYVDGKRLEIALPNQKKFILLTGELAATRADVLVRFTDEHGNARDAADDADLRRLVGPTFDDKLRQSLSGIPGGRLQPGSVVGMATDGPVTGQGICSVSAPVDRTDPDFVERLARAYDGCFGLAITGPALSVAFPTMSSVESADTVVEHLLKGMLSENRLRRVYLVSSSTRAGAFPVYAKAIVKRLNLHLPVPGVR